MTTTRFIAALLALGLSGCAGTYTIKNGEPTALVRFTTNAPDSTIFREVPEPLCDPAQGNNMAVFTMFTAKHRPDVQMLGAAPRPNENTYQRAVGAAKPLYMLASTFDAAGPGAPGGSCSVGLRWQPVPGHQYEIGYELDQRGCRVRVAELVQTETGVERRVDPSVRFIRARYTKDFCGQ
jgi:hypothetical protein